MSPTLPSPSGPAKVSMATSLSGQLSLPGPWATAGREWSYLGVDYSFLRKKGWIIITVWPWVSYLPWDLSFLIITTSGVNFVAPKYGNWAGCSESPRKFAKTDILGSTHRD